MPLVGYHLLGFDAPASFDKSDFQLLQSPEHQEKTEAFFTNCPHRLNFFFHNRKWDRDHQWLLHGRIGQETSRGPRYPTGRTSAEDIEFFLAGRPRDPNAINFIFTSNASGKPKFPLSPWMMGHRMGHMQMLYQDIPEILLHLEKFGRDVLSLVYDHKTPFYGQHYTAEGYHCRKNPHHDALYFHALWKALTTSRAGRNHAVNGFDYIPEWLAQYLRFGEVRFPIYMPDRLNLQELYQHEKCVKTPIPEGELVSRWRYYPTSDIARCFGWLFEKVLNKWCGGVIVT